MDDSLLDDDSTPEELAAAQAAALRGKGPPALAPDPQALQRQRQFGNLATLIGGPLQGIGQAQLADTRQQQASSLNAQRYGQLNDYRAQMAATAKQRADEKAANDAQIETLKQQLADRQQKQLRKDGSLVAFDPNTGEAKVALAGPKLLKGGKGGSATGAPDDLAGLKPNQVQKLWTDFGNSISTVKGRGNLNSTSQASLYRAEALEKLLDVPDLNSITPQQMREASTSLAGLISRGGSQAVSQIEHLTPESYAGQFADFKQKLLNEPQGADAKAFLQNMLETARREKGLVQEQMRKGQIQAVPRFAALRKQNPTQFDAMLKQAGIDPASIDATGQLQTPAAPQGPPGVGGSPQGAVVVPAHAHPQAAAALAAAKKILATNPTDPVALEVVKRITAGAPNG